MHRTDGKHTKHHKKHHHHKHAEEKKKEAPKQEKNDEEGDQDVETKQFDQDDLEAYTSNAINNHFNEMKRKGLKKNQEVEKKGSVDLTTSLNENEKS